MPKIAFTCGDINGIGPEICIKTINEIQPTEHPNLIFICPADVFKRTSQVVTPKFDYKIIDYADENVNAVTILNFESDKLDFGKPTITSGKAAKRALEITIDLFNTDIINSVVTAPISKEAMYEIDFHYPGHTEFFADKFDVDDFAMMFVADKMKCSLLTIHEPLSDIPELITKSRIENHIKLVVESLHKDFGIERPKIAVLGLNPHAGENGSIGNEEIEVIKPALAEMYNNDIEGPFVPDAFFGNKLYEKFDLFVGMYHDQALIPFKMLNFNNGVNYTAGIPLIRTSPDHGTAFDIAGQGKADHSSMYNAYQWVQIISQNRNAG